MLKNSKLFCLSILLFIKSICLFADSSSLPLPGRLGNPNVYKASFGSCDIYFYMTPEKYDLALSMIPLVNDNLPLTLSVGSPPCPELTVIIQAIKEPNIHLKSQSMYENYAKQAFANLENTFGFQLLGRSFYGNLFLNWEGLRIHQDSFRQQYSYLESTKSSLSDFAIVQDLTLIDWEMAKGTVSGTMIQDGPEGDRYILTLFPKEIVGTFYTEPAENNLSIKTNIYPGYSSMPFHSGIPPMDYLGLKNAGSSKGKRMSSLARGLVINKAIDALNKKSIKLELNRKTLDSTKEGKSYVYSNGIELKNLSDFPIPLDCKTVCTVPNPENLEILSIPVDKNKAWVEALLDVFSQKLDSWEKAQIFRIYKRDSGFSSFAEMNLPIASNSTVILLNRSDVPKDYHCFSLSQDWTRENLPWIQLYRFEPSYGMRMSYSNFIKLSLPPLEELLYRDELKDKYVDDYANLMQKLTTCIDILVLFN